MTRFLFSALAHNANVYQHSLALHEQHMLGLYLTGAVDHWRSPVMRALRQSPVAKALNADRMLSRRKIPGLPEDMIQTRWFWDVVSQFGRFVPNTQLLGDWCWEQSELSADHEAARLLEGSEFTALMSVEHQALESLKTAKRLGKPGLLIFTSPHYKTYEKWVEPEYERFPQLQSPVVEELAKRADRRNQRRDQEMETADFLLSNSKFTGQSLVDGGADPGKVLVLPLGCPATQSMPQRPAPDGSSRVRYLYSGPVSVRKGAPYLIEAWRRFTKDRPGVELHLCGSLQLPASLLEGLPDNLHIHGNVSSQDLQAQYDAADYLVFPTLCDGFGLVVCEALARGLPVITTHNAGAADLIRSGENGLLIRPREVDDLVRSLEWGLESKNRLPELRQAAWETARDWTWADFRAELIKQLHERLPQN